MAEFLVNVALIAALLVLLIIWAVTAGRRRRADRREHAAERRLILAAFTAAAPQAEIAATEDETDEPAPPRPARRATTNPAAQQPLDAASVTALLNLLEDRHPARRGMIAGLLTSPRSVWSAGTRAGQRVGQPSMPRPQHHKAPRGERAAELYRAAASELVDIHAHDPGDAHAEYTRYAAAVGDPALAELYVRSAAYATYPEHDQVHPVLQDIIGDPRPPDVSDDDASIDA